MKNNSEINLFKKSFEDVSQSYPGFLGATDERIDSYISSVQQEIDILDEELMRTADTKQDINIAKGFVAEAWHAGTHNINAAAKGVKERAILEKRTDFASPDITCDWGEQYGSKYFKDGIQTAKAQSKSFFERYCDDRSKNPGKSFSDFLRERNINEDNVLMHDPIYQGQLRIVPKDQLEEAVDFLKNMILKESSTRPELVHKFEETLSNITDRIKSTYGSESIPLTEEEARLIVREVRHHEFDRNLHGLSTKNFVKWPDVFRESGKAALNAAVISAVLKSSPYIWQCIKDYLSDGSINPERLKDAGTAAFKGSVEGALKGGIAASITCACKAELLGDSLISVNPTVIAAATVVSIRTIYNAIDWYQGKLTPYEFSEKCLRDTFVVTVGIMGASIGQTLIPIPVLGALIGNFVGSILASVIFDGGKQLFFGFFIESGISFFNIVKQDHSIPDEVLREIGFDLIELEEIQLEGIELEEIELEEIDLETIDISILERGLISVNIIGYIPV